MYYSVVLKMTHNCFQLVNLTGLKREKKVIIYAYDDVMRVTLFNSGSQTRVYIYYIWINKFYKAVVLLPPCVDCFNSAEAKAMQRNDDGEFEFYTGGLHEL